MMSQMGLLWQHFRPSVNRLLPTQNSLMQSKDDSKTVLEMTVRIPASQNAFKPTHTYIYRPANIFLTPKDIQMRIMGNQNQGNKASHFRSKKAECDVMTKCDFKWTSGLSRNPLPVCSDKLSPLITFPPPVPAKSRGHCLCLSQSKLRHQITL